MELEASVSWPLEPESGVPRENRFVRILEVVVRYPPYIGGVELATHQLAKQWAERGEQVRVLCAAEPEQPAALDGVSVHRLPYLGKIGNTNLCWSLGRALRLEDADMVHSSLPTAGFADRAAAEASRRRMPFVLTYYNDLVGTGHVGLLAALYNRLLLPPLLRRSARVVVSRRDLDWVSPRLQTVRSKLVPIPLGVDLDRFSPRPIAPSSETRIGFLSVLDAQHRYKGLVELLRGIAGAVQRGCRIRLVVGGDGGARPELERLATELGLDAVAQFVGRIPDAHLPSFYRNLDLFALPSTDRRQEGFGLVALEAMACGRPVLITEVPAVAADVLRNGAGLVLASPTAEAIEQALVELAATVNRAEALQRMGSIARAVVERHYAWPQVAEAYLQVFREHLDSADVT